MGEFYCRQTELLAQWAYPWLVFLLVKGRPIAFAFGWESKGVLQVWKIGYDPKLSQFSPGQILWRLWLEKLMEKGTTRLMHSYGPMVEAIQLWANVSYPAGRIVIGTSWTGQMFINGYRAYRSLRAKLAKHASDSSDWASQCNIAAPKEIGLQREAVWSHVLFGFAKPSDTVSHENRTKRRHEELGPPVTVLLRRLRRP